MRSWGLLFCGVSVLCVMNSRLAVALSSFAECCGDVDADFVAEQEVDCGESESDYGERNECGCVVGLC